MAGAAPSESVSLSGSSGRVGRVFTGMRGVFSIESASVPGSCVAEEELGRVDGPAFGVAWELWLDSVSSSPSGSINEGIRGRVFKGTNGSVSSWNICSWIQRVPAITGQVGRIGEKKPTRLSIRLNNVCHQVPISPFNVLFTSVVSGSAVAGHWEDTFGELATGFTSSDTRAPWMNCTRGTSML